jgi:hypothetical protein
MTAECRASIILSADRFIGNSFGPATKASLRKAYSPELRSALAQCKQADWTPRAHLVELLTGIVSVHGPTPQSVKKLNACGRAIFDDATNTFIRLVLKMATPAIFARKFPDFWQRDFRNSGYGKVDATELDRNHITVSFHDVEGFNYMPPLGIGFVGLAMERVTGKKVTMELRDWSFDNPGPSQTHYEVSW